MKRNLYLMIVAVLLSVTFALGTSTAAAEVKADVKVDTYKIESIKEDCGIKIIYPILSGFNSASKLNDRILNKNIDSIGYIRGAWSALLRMKEDQKAAGEEISKVGVSLESNFDYSKSGNILSVIMNEYSFAGGAHGASYIDSFTVNTKTDEIYTFNSLFNQKSNYKKVIVEKINTMIDKEKDLYFENAKKTLADRNTNDFQFYIDGSNLVIYFSLYDLRPYAGGIPKFSIAAKDLKGLLKEEVYSQIINAKSLENTRLNGTSLSVPYKTYEQDYTLMVPLKHFAETLGYTVGWDSENGASVAGGYIKNNVNSYYASDKSKAPCGLSAPPKTIKNRLFVPLQYFSQILKEDVSYDGEIARLYKYAAKDESQFPSQIVEFILPTSAEQCVQMYAEAVQKRTGAIQYALYSEKLRAATKSKFESLNWVTGVSSPWITGYDIKNTGKGTYDILFHWATSAGSEPDSSTRVIVEETAEQEYWKITSVQE